MRNKNVPNEKRAERKNVRVKTKMFRPNITFER